MRLRALGAAMLTLGLAVTLWVLATAMLHSSASSIQAAVVDSNVLAPGPMVEASSESTAVPPRPSVEASSVAVFPGTTHRTVVKGSNFRTNTNTKLFFDHPDGDSFKFRVVSSTRIVLFVRVSSVPPDQHHQPLKMVAIDTGAGAVQLNPEDGGVVIGALIADTSSRPVRHDEDSPRRDDAPSVRASSTAIERETTYTPLHVQGANFDLGYTELYFSPPLREEALGYYRIGSSDTILLGLKHENLEPGALKVVAIDAGGGLVSLEPESGGVVIAVIFPTLIRDHGITVDENDTLRIYQSTKQFQITGSGFQNNTKVLFKHGLCGGDTRSTLHTKLGEDPHQLTLALAEGNTWINEDLRPSFPAAPLELWSANAGNGWAAALSGTVAVVLPDPSIHASDTELHHKVPKGLTIRGTGIGSWKGSRKLRLGSKPVKRGEKKVYETVPPRLDFDPPIDPEFVRVDFLAPDRRRRNHEKEIRVSLQHPLKGPQPEWAPPGYFGPLKVKGVDTGAGMVALNPPVTVANIIPGSTEDLFLMKRIEQLREDCTFKRRQDRADQAIREWEAMTLAERTQTVGALVPTPSVKSSSVEIYASQTERLVVEGDNFLQDTRLVFDPPLRDGSFWQQVGGILDHGIDPRGVAPTRIELERFMHDPEASSWWRAEPGPLKVVAIENDAGLTPLNPEGGGVVVAMVKVDPEVQDNEGLLIYQSTEQLRITGTGFDDDVEVEIWSPVKPVFTVTDVKPDEFTLRLEGGSTWSEETSSLPSALMVDSVKCGPGLVEFRHGSSFLGLRKIATVFEDPTIQASGTNIFRGFTREFSVNGSGFNKVVAPVLEFDPPLDVAAVSIHVVYRTMIRLTLSTSAADWTRTADYLGPLTIKGVDTGAGLVVLDPPVTVATVVQDVGTHDNEVAQVSTKTNVDTIPSVDASTFEIFPHRENDGIYVNGANFHPKSKFHFDSNLSEGLELQQMFLSPRQIVITKAVSTDEHPIPWRAEPGPLTIVGVDTGAGMVQLNPEGGGVVVAMVREDVVVQENESLRIYQSAKEIQVDGSGFGDGIYVMDAYPWTPPLHIDIVSPNQLTLSLEEENSVWMQGSQNFPEALRVYFGGAVLVGREDPYYMYGIGDNRVLGGIVATVFEDPSINASDAEINRTGAQGLVVWGIGFNNMTKPVMDFEPPLDSSNLDVKVVNRTMIQLSLYNAQAGWVAEEHLGALKIKGVDNGAGKVVFDSPVTVATVVPDAEPKFNQGMDINIHALVLDSPEAGNAVESEEGDCNDKEGDVQVDNTFVPPPFVEANSEVVDMKATDSLVVNGGNFDLATRLIFEPPLGTGFEMRVFSRTEIDVFTKFPAGGVPIPWRTEPGPLKVVAIETAAGFVQLNPEEGGVMVAMVEYR